jgi:hypothetical protein
LQLSLVAEGAVYNHSQAEIAGKGYAGIMDCGTTTFRTEGTRGLYKGMMPSMLAGVPYVGLQMTFYDMLKVRRFVKTR